ncbi:MAG: response regulator [Candidatus Tritonobacter lacicola]|nr:response regulator [Candidatus Tritonobacter lacicola]
MKNNSKHNIKYQRPLTTGEVGRYCSVSYNTVSKWVKNGKLKAYRTPGGHYRIRKGDLISFLKKHDIIVPDALLIEKKRVLIVDDEPEMVQIIEDTLREGEEEFDIASAYNGYGACLKIGNFRPDLVILDIKMPDIDGFEVCRRIKISDETKKMKVLVITAYPESSYIRRIREAGADSLMTKPFDLQGLRERVLSLLT